MVLHPLSFLRIYRYDRRSDGAKDGIGQPIGRKTGYGIRFSVPIGMPDKNTTSFADPCMAMGVDHRDFVDQDREYSVRLSSKEKATVDP